MNTMKKAKLTIAAAAAALCCVSFADDTAKRDDGEATRIWLPLGLSILTPPVQLPNPTHSLFGAMLNVGYGQMTDVAILDLGLVNNVTRNMVGLEVGPVDLAGTCLGAQVGAINWAGTLFGVQLGVVNITDDLHGLQLGVLNFSSNGGAWVFPILNFGF